MSSIRSVVITGPNAVEVQQTPAPQAGPNDAIVRVRACGICGSDTFYISIGGIPPRQGATRLGHEIAGEIIEVGAEVRSVKVGDHVVVNPQAAPSGIIGNGGALGGFDELLLIEQPDAFEALRVVPDDIPFEALALNEPMAVASHAVNRSEPQPGDKVVIFGAGPIGLGALIDFTLRGVASIVVVDVVPGRLAKALELGADAVIDSSTEDLDARLRELHGEAPAHYGRVRNDTDIYLDAAGAPSVPTSFAALTKHGARFTVVAVHKKPVELDFGDLLTFEPTIRTAVGYPTEIFEVTDKIIAAWDRYRRIVSDVLPSERVLEALELAGTPGAADKVVVTFGAEQAS